MVTTIAGNGASVPFVDAPGTQASFFDPMGIAVDAMGHLYLADYTNQRVRKLAVVSGTENMVSGLMRKLFSAQMGGQEGSINMLRSFSLILRTDRVVPVSRKHLRQCGKCLPMCGVQPGDILSGRYSPAVELPCGFLLPSNGQ